MENETNNNTGSQEESNSPEGSVRFSPPENLSKEPQSQFVHPEPAVRPFQFQQPAETAQVPPAQFTPAVNQLPQSYPVRNDASNKGLIVGIVVGILVLVLVVAGILASVVLVSLNSAKSKARDAAIKSYLLASSASMALYYDNHGSYNGFNPEINFSADILTCSGQPIASISPDGKNMAIFAKLCSAEGQYFCVDPVNGREVNEQYAKSGAYICNEEDLNNGAETKVGNSMSGTELNSTTSSDSKLLDDSILPSIVAVSDELGQYQIKNKTYTGFDKSILNQYMTLNTNCNSILKLDISPDGTEYVLHRPLCSDSTKSFCAEKDSQDTHMVSTEYVEKTYHCGPEIE
jgi:type II secretory pathway pseudopilin PulG